MGNPDVESHNVSLRVLRMPTVRFRLNKDSQLHSWQMFLNKPSVSLPWVINVINPLNKETQDGQTNMVQQSWALRVGSGSSAGTLGQPLPPTPFTLLTYSVQHK